MAYEIELNGDGISGFLIRSSEAGETATFTSSGFISDNDGEFFYKVMEGFQAAFLDPAVKARLSPAQVDHALVLIEGKKATVYINDFNLICETLPRRAIQKGERVYEKDMIGITRLSFQDIPIPDDTGIAFFFSIGWRRGFFFDFRPDGTETNKLKNIEVTLGKHYETVMYNRWYSLNDSLWALLINLGWFPFVGLIGNKNFDFLIDRLRDGSSTDNAETRLVESFDKPELKTIEDRLKANLFLSPHIQVFERGIERYLNADYVSSINNVWPRVEGILRYNYSKKAKENIKPLLSNMASSFDGSFAYPGIFFPQYFRSYLDSYYFQDFDLPNAQLQVSRHSVAHGVSNIADYDRKRALIGILMADQLGYYINAGRKSAV